MRPSERGDVRQKLVGAVETVASSGSDGLSKMLGVPEYDDRGQQVQTCQTVMLALGGAIADFALTTDTEGVFQGMMGFSLVQTNIGAALHVDIEQPVDDE